MRELGLEQGRRWLQPFTGGVRRGAITVDSIVV